MDVPIKSTQKYDLAYLIEAINVLNNFLETTNVLIILFSHARSYIFDSTMVLLAFRASESTQYL